MTPTKLLYLEDFSVVSGPAAVLAIEQQDDGRDVVLLDQTVFYPQGGGQPYDTGAITSSTAKFLVEEVRFVDGLVRHIGKFESGEFSVGDAVSCQVDEERRSLHSRLHSAGHVVDMAVNALGLTEWIAGKGYHFPNGPYVEYEASLGDTDRESLRAQIEAKCNELIATGAPAKLVFMEKEKMHEVCAHVPDYLPEGKPARVVLFGTFGVPCGGTHVRDIAEIKSMTIRKVKPEGKNIRVAYDVAR